NAHPLDPDAETDIAGLRVRALALPHGDRTVLGYRVGPVAYLTDAKEIPETARAQLAGLEVLVLNALLPRPHPLHLSIPEAVAAARQIGARRTFLTHLTHQASHAELAAGLPDGIAPAYDGLVIDLGAVEIRRREDVSWRRHTKRRCGGSRIPPCARAPRWTIWCGRPCSAPGPSGSRPAG